MRLHASPLAGAFVAEIEPHADARGFFARTWCANEFREHGLESEMVQASISRNERRGTVRGMHLQLPPSHEAKLVRATRVARPVADLALQLPADVAADHPLVKKHRVASAAGDRPASARRTRMTEPGPKSPWRRRLLARPIAIHVPTGLDAASQSLRQWWERLRLAVSEIAAVARRG